MRPIMCLALALLLAACSSTNFAPTPTTTLTPPPTQDATLTPSPTSTLPFTSTPTPTASHTPTPVPGAPALLVHVRGSPARTGVYNLAPLAAPPAVRRQKTGLGLGVHGAPVVVGDTLYVPTQIGRLRAFAAQTGDLLWTFGSPDRREGPRPLYALDAATGDELWSFLADSRLLSAPALGDGLLYLLTTYGTLYALE